MKARSIVIGVLVVLMLALAACGAGGNDGEKGGGLGADGGPESLTGGYTWRRVGGIAGFCDVVTLAADGSATIASCRTEPPQTVAETRLTAAQLRLVSGWVARYDSFEHEQTDPATADALTIVIRFQGRGSEEPSETDLAALAALAQEVLVQATQ